MLGNFPQAYSHVGLINSALSLDQYESSRKEQAAPRAIRRRARAKRNETKRNETLPASAFAAKQPDFISVPRRNDQVVGRQTSGT
jgi:hypothetical protein